MDAVERTISEQRLDILPIVLAQVQEKSPEIAGITIFGSTATGRARAESDVDGYLYLDMTVLGLKLSDLEVDRSTRTNAVSYWVPKEKEATYLGEFRQRLAEALKLPTDKLDGVKLFPIGEELIDLELKKLKDEIVINEEYAEVMAARRSMTWQELMTVEAPHAPALPYPSQNIFGLLYPSFGVGVFHMRETLIRKLLEYGDSGEKMWEQIVYMVNRFQREHLMEFPETLVDAIKWYKIDEE